MSKNYNWNKPSEQRHFFHDMSKLAEKKAESIKRKMESSYVFFQRPNTNFPYSPVNENPVYDLHRIRCPKCLKEIGVKIGTNHCAWCDFQIEVTQNTHFLP